jgi:hypothetical protein
VRPRHEDEVALVLLRVDADEPPDPYLEPCLLAHLARNGLLGRLLVLTERPGSTQSALPRRRVRSTSPRSLDVGVGGN